MRKFSTWGTFPVLCLDDFEPLLSHASQFTGEFYDNLRSLVDARLVMLLIASGETLTISSRKYGLKSNFFPGLETIDLNRGFSEEEAELLIQRKGLTLNTELIALEWGQQQPGLLQLAGQCLWDMGQQGGSINRAKRSFNRQAKRLHLNPKLNLYKTIDLALLNVGTYVLAWFHLKAQPPQTQRLVGLVLAAIGIGASISFMMLLVTLFR
ncbi:MAG: hypothetical protein HC796_12125 [Synechococcaceae cyanobacterium RL_1_2]|nr:hypothetical protein [Synechococcaceae cyanobacterium RL_1_2]